MEEEGISAILGKVGPRLKDFSSRTFRCLLAHSCHIGASNRGDENDVEDMYGDGEDVVDIEGYD